MNNIPASFELVSSPYGHAPLRRPHSVRRTSTLDTSWPDGREGDLYIAGRCRDLVSNEDIDHPHIAREDHMSATLGWDRVIHSIENDRLDLSVLVGARGGGHLRKLLNASIHAERVDGSPLYLLLDDISGVSLVSGWAWSRWAADGETPKSPFANMEERRALMENICTGFTTGSSALTVETGPKNNPQIVPLPNPLDAFSWHQLPEVKTVGFRRARRIDVWREDDKLVFDVGFQDSASDPDLGRVALHEYHVTGYANSNTGTLEEIVANPHVLPFPECPGAIANIQGLVSLPLNEMRDQVIKLLPGTRGCTHLNDMLRAMAEIPILVAALDA
ncbi:MAG: DUF2889 domain-containing protein [Pseudomonadales bacterium]|nr:DUF2889 domain-containing protein [Pseudomonadales bacterium]